MSNKFSLPLILGLAHAMADGAAGMLLGDLPRTISLKEVGLLVLLYNVLAFGSQPLLGLLTDRLERPRAALLFGIALLGGALVVSPWHAPVAVALAGLGSAAFHVGGGALALSATPGRAAGPGLFAAPGVLGLAVGGALAITGHAIIWPFLLLLAVLALAVFVLPLPPLPYTTAESEPLMEGHDLIMLALLAAIAMRSAIWTTLQYLLEGRIEILLGLAVAALVGKVLGGFMADRWGWRRWTLGALALAAPLLTFGGGRLWTLLSGVALLQSATPVGLAVARSLLPRSPALASGLVLGLAVAVGGVPGMLGLGPLLGAPFVVLGIIAAMMIAFAWSLRRAK